MTDDLKALIDRLDSMARHDEKMVGYATLGGELYNEAAAALRRLAEENEMTDQVRRKLRKKIEELENTVHLAKIGWNGANQRAERAEAERDALKHDIERYTDRDTQRLAEVDALRELLLRAKDTLLHHDCLPCRGNCDGCVLESDIDAAICLGRHE